MADWDLYHKAIKQLPSAYVHKETRTCVFNQVPLAINPNLPPIEFVDGAWVKVRLHLADLDEKAP